MPLFRLAKQRLHPDGAFAHRLGIGFRAVVCADSLAIRLVERTVELPAFAALRTPGSDGARLTRGGRRLIDADLGHIVIAPNAKDGPLRAAIDVPLRVVGEVALAEERTALAPVRQWDVSANPVRFQALEVLPRPVGGVAHGPFRTQFPAKADAPQELQ